MTDEAGVSASVLRERFRPIAAMRLDEAERLQRALRLSIAEIALRVGFYGRAALTRALERRRGVTPGAARRRPARRLVDG